MKRTKSDKRDHKLVLNHERVRELSNDRLKAAAGGRDAPSFSDECTLTAGG
jgi:hypothetical protein